MEASNDRRRLHGMSQASEHEPRRNGPVLLPRVVLQELVRVHHMPRVLRIRHIRGEVVELPVVVRLGIGASALVRLWPSDVAPHKRHNECGCWAGPSNALRAYAGRAKGP